MNEPLKTTEVCQLLDIKQPTLHKYTDEFQLNVIVEMQGKQKVILYPDSEIQKLKDIMNWKKENLSFFEIKKKLGLNAEIIEVEPNYNPTMDQSQLNSNPITNNSELNHDKSMIAYQDPNNNFQEFIQTYFNRVDKLIHFSNNTQLLNKELGEYKARLEEKESFIQYLQANHDSNMNQSRSYYESVINELRLNHELIMKKLQSNHDAIINQMKLNHDKEIELLKSELEVKNNEIESLRKRLYFWQKK